MAKKAELEKALDLVEDVVSAENDKAKAKAVKALEKFEDSTSDKALADKLENLVEKLEDKDEAPAKAEVAPAEPEKTEEQKAQEAADYEAVRKRMRIRGGADYPDRQ